MFAGLNLTYPERFVNSDANYTKNESQIFDNVQYNEDIKKVGEKAILCEYSFIPQAVF